MTQDKRMNNDEAMTNTIDPGVLRRVAGAFATGITIVSCYTEDGAVYGMTANSFLSVSLDPALVLISVQNTGTLMDHLIEGLPLGISVLSAEQEHISNHFAGRPIEGAIIDFEAKITAPVISDNMAWYSTVVHQVVPAGDHHLVICAVRDCERDETKSPLLYYNGYQRLD